MTVEYVTLVRTCDEIESYYEQTSAQAGWKLYKRASTDYDMTWRYTKVSQGYQLAFDLNCQEHTATSSTPPYQRFDLSMEAPFPLQHLICGRSGRAWNHQSLWGCATSNALILIPHIFASSGSRLPVWFDAAFPLPYTVRSAAAPLLSSFTLRYARNIRMTTGTTDDRARLRLAREIAALPRWGSPALWERLRSHDPQASASSGALVSYLRTAMRRRDASAARDLHPAPRSHGPPQPRVGKSNHGAHAVITWRNSR
jgi:hypothetical protein